MGTLALMYHRFDEPKYPSTNIQMNIFKEQIKIINKSNYKFYNPLEFKKDFYLPKKEKKILITIDDAFSSFYNNAWPCLKKNKIPFILFVSTKAIGEFGYMNWNQIREIEKEKFVYIGNHSHSHDFLVEFTKEDFLNDINNSIEIFKKQLGYNPIFFSYPFGEYSEYIKDNVKKKFDLSFGQHSGVISRFSDKKYLPRFALNEKYGELNRFRLIINTLPLPVSEFTPSSPIIGKTNPPNVGFTVIPSLKNLNGISCFTSEEGKVSTTLLSTSRVEVRMTKPFIKGRNRLNCTLPGGGGRWHWLGAIFVVPKS